MIFKVVVGVVVGEVTVDRLEDGFDSFGVDADFYYRVFGKYRVVFRERVVYVLFYAEFYGD